jgi:hypothetical protein
MPGYNATVVGGLGKNLIMPKPHASAEKLGRRHQKSWIPQQIMKRRGNTPGAEGVKKDLVWIG